MGSRGSFWRLLTALAVAMALLASACGGSTTNAATTDTAASSAADGGGNDTASADADQEDDQADDGPESFEDIEFDSPLAEFLGFDVGAGEEGEAQQLEMQREAERLTATCMREQGFEYTPQDVDNGSFFGGIGDDLPYFSDEWVEKYGFGITTQSFPQSQVGDLVGYNDERGILNGSEIPQDPNQEYLETLSEGEREAYEAALWGLPPDFGEGEPTEEDFANFEPSGCQFEAFDEAFNQGGVDFIEFDRAFGDQLQAMEERVMADPAMVAFNDEVASCVSEAGMTWIDQEELYSRFEPRLGQLQSFGDETGDPFADAGVNPEEMSEEEMSDFFNELNRLDPSQLAVLAELQAEELALARVVVLECGGGPLNEFAVTGNIRAQYEQEFLDANATELEALVGDG